MQMSHYHDSVEKAENWRYVGKQADFVVETPNQSFRIKRCFLYSVFWISWFTMQSTEFETLLEQMKEMKLIKAAAALEEAIQRTVGYGS